MDILMCVSKLAEADQGTPPLGQNFFIFMQLLEKKLFK